MITTSVSISRTRELLIRLLATSASLAGFCVAGIGLLHSQSKAHEFESFGDDILALAAVFFLLCTYLSFWALRTQHKRRLFTLAKIIDTLFLIGLTLTVISGVGFVYAIL
ncbi:hypothetical protein [Nitrosomonas sp.]|uniref:hypothetical protein n=1 Tax=Nitrosomonas sp. TaxID=42353 RepID=UPI001DAD8721|nr:hypothetical protein [Nitrosomonas sp.]MBX3615969.1 hypothetical protein [Nitrosomonas sp.]